MCVSWSAHFHHPRRIYWKTPQEEGCTIKTVIYLDVLLLVNFLLGALFLLAAGLLSGQRCAAGRLLAEIDTPEDLAAVRSYLNNNPQL